MLVRIFRRFCWFALIVLALIAVQVLLPVVDRTQWYAVLFATELGYLLATVALLLLALVAGLSRWLPFRRRWFALIAAAVAIIGFYPVFSAGYHFSSCFNFDEVWERAFEQPVTYARKQRYSDLNQPSLHYYFYPPEPRLEKPPVAVLIHGGGWRSRQMGLGTWLIARLNRLGYAVVAPEYSLAPEANFPQPLHDLDALYRHLEDHQADLQIDLTNISLIGRSAGAHLASLWAYTRPEVPVKKVVGLYGVYDMAAAWREAPEVRMHDGRKILRQFMGSGFQDAPELYGAASPVAHLHDAIPPTLLIHGGRDDWVPASQAAAMRRKQHDDVEVVILPWATHGFDAVPYSPGGLVAACHIERQLSDQ